MSNLETLGLKPTDLMTAQQDLVLALVGNSCAWKQPRGWRTKRPGKDFQGRTGESLIRLQLAELHFGKGSPRLVLTSAGEEMAGAIKAHRTERANRKKRSAA